MAGFLLAGLIVWGLLYLGWFFGRVHEATIEDQLRQQDEAAYRWAAQHNRLPEPRVIEHWVDTETGEVLGTREL